ncbi:hypothetical protein ACFLUH_02080 [Chloroflexota bacterium]
MKLNQKKEQILKALAEERELNPRTYLAGLSTMGIGVKVGARPPMDVINDLQDLLLSGFINKERFKRLINGKGICYLKTYRK